MKKELLWALGLLILAALVATVTCDVKLGTDPTPPTSPVAPKPVPPGPVVQRPLLYFASKSCTWCRKLEAELPLPEVQEALKGYVLKHVDEKDRITRLRYRVTGYPTLVITNSAGKELTRKVGFCEVAELVAWLKQTPASKVDADPIDKTTPVLPD